VHFAKPALFKAGESLVITLSGTVGISILPTITGSLGSSPLRRRRGGVADDKFAEALRQKDAPAGLVNSSKGQAAVQALQRRHRETDSRAHVRLVGPTVPDYINSKPPATEGLQARHSGRLGADAQCTVTPKKKNEKKMKKILGPGFESPSKKKS
jgi:hypothetical protein